MKRFAQVTFIVAVILVTTVIGVNLKERGKKADPFRDFSVFAKVYNIVLARYVEPVEDAFLMEGAYRGAVESVFDQNSYIPARMMENLEPRLKEPARVGIDIIKRGGYAQVVHVAPDSEADRKGLEAGTVLQQINGQYTWDLSLFAIKALLRGKAGETVTLTYYEMGRGEDVDETFSYEEIHQPEASLVDIEAYKALRIHRFGPDTVQTVREFMDANGHLILDLRFTQDAGYADMLTLAATLAGEELTATRKRKDGNENLTAKPADPITGPVFILTAGFTMNAADTLANLVKGKPGITLVGGRTSGKAFEMELFQLEDGAFVEMATTFYMPTTENGLKPDIRSFIDDSEIAQELKKLLEATENGTEAAA